MEINLKYTEEHYEHFQKNGDKNYFEELVDKVVLDATNIDDSIKKMIISMPREKKRMALLSVIDDERSLFSNIKANINSNIGRMEHIEDVVLMLRKYVKDAEVQKKKFGEVMTPLELVKEMIDQLPKDVWSNPELKWLDPANGTGPFPSIVIYKLMKGLKDWEPDDDKRYKHIVENMIYVSEIQPKNMFLFMCAFDPFDIYKLNVYTGSFLDDGFNKHMKEVWGLDKFDVVIGNPPYQENIEGNKRARPIYNDFVEKSIEISKKTLLIVPSRWLAGGFGLDEFRKMMFTRNDIKLIKHFDNAKEIFGNDVDIKGGVSYFLIDVNYCGDILFDDIYCKLNKYDIWVNPKYHQIIEKVLIISGSSLKKICKSQSYFGFPGNESLFKKTKEDGLIKVYVSKKRGDIMWVDNSNIKDSKKKSGYKVFTTAAAGSSNKLGVFGNKIIGFPNEVASKSFMTFLTNSENESKSLISYMNTKFCLFFLSLRKNTHNLKPDTLSWIPMVSLDREWTDELLFEYFKLTDEEIGLILGK
jgi:site-specific DNA-methyltransferase (adenine-specific)